jgi:signal transduction histidine kinase
MSPEDHEPSSEREQTDESLRVEREKADDALGEEGSGVDALADAVISRARARADEVLAAARARTDRQASTPALNAPPPDSVKQERMREDEALQSERTTADEILQEERAEHVALLARERADTDHDLSTERARSDDALATRDDFLGIVSHDLRNILNAVVGSAALIERGMPSTDRRVETLKHAQRIQRAGAHMDRLIGDLVDLASIQAGVLAVTREIGDPMQAVEEAVEIFQPQASASGVSLLAEIVRPSPLVLFDPARILQVLTNLLSNAMKFTPAGGTVIVRAEQCGEEVRIAVTDSGVGIPTESLEAVFGRFLQVTKNDRRGVGLGLYISKAIVQGHGGRIWVESIVGQGSTFWFTLPIHVTAG